MIVINFDEIVGVFISIFGRLSSSIESAKIPKLCPAVRTVPLKFCF